jgi:hypothetical protein
MLFVVVFISSFNLSAQPRAYYAGRREMVDKSDLIAVVSIDKVVECEKKGLHWTYSQYAKAKVLELIKGKAGSLIDIYGGENFKCGRNSLYAGKVLVFLSKEGDYYTGCNWAHSSMPITEGKVNWMTDPDGLKLKETGLKQVIADIKADMLIPTKPQKH